MTLPGSGWLITTGILLHDCCYYRTTENITQITLLTTECLKLTEMLSEPPNWYRGAAHVTEKQLSKSSIQ